MALVHRKDSDIAAYFNACSLHHPPESDDLDATSSARLAAQISYVLACGRLAHYLIAMIRDKVATVTDRERVQHALDRWIADYVDDTSSAPAEAVRVPRPFAKARIFLQQPAGELSAFAAKFWIRPNL